MLINAELRKSENKTERIFSEGSLLIKQRKKVLEKKKRISKIKQLTKKGFNVKQIHTLTGYSIPLIVKTI